MLGTLPVDSSGAQRSPTMPRSPGGSQHPASVFYNQAVNGASPGVITPCETNVTANFVIVVMAAMIEIGRISLTEQNMANQRAQACEAASRGLQWPVSRAVEQGAGGSCSTVDSSLQVDGYQGAVKRECGARRDPNERISTLCRPWRRGAPLLPRTIFVERWVP